MRWPGNCWSRRIARSCLSPTPLRPRETWRATRRRAGKCLIPWREFTGRIHMLHGEHDQHAVKGIIGLCSFFIGSRMHACIAALSQGIPTVAVAYSKKFMGVFESAGMGHMVVDARDTSTDAGRGQDPVSLQGERKHKARFESTGSEPAETPFGDVQIPSAGGTHRKKPFAKG